MLKIFNKFFGSEIKAEEVSASSIGGILKQVDFSLCKIQSVKYDEDQQKIVVLVVGEGDYKKPTHASNVDLFIDAYLQHTGYRNLRIVGPHRRLNISFASIRLSPKTGYTLSVAHPDGNFNVATGKVTAEIAYRLAESMTKVEDEAESYPVDASEIRVWDKIRNLDLPTGIIAKYKKRIAEEGCSFWHFD